ncbi:MAG: hypothetical protein ACUVQO_17545 [Leptodesmis sp.]
MRTYIGQGLRADLEWLESDTVSALIASLKRHGVSDEVIQDALGEVTEHSNQPQQHFRLKPSS